jgi:hypothetical protein
MAVRDFWNAYNPDGARDEGDRWEVSALCPPPYDWNVSYQAPGSFFVYVGSRVVNVRASLRWRGFLSFEPLRRVHLPALRKIAGLLGASRIVYLPDDDPVLDAAKLEGASLDDCIGELGRRWGPPQVSIEVIDPEVDPLTWVRDDGRHLYRVDEYPEMLAANRGKHCQRA